MRTEDARTAQARSVGGGFDWLTARDTSVSVSVHVAMGDQLKAAGNKLGEAAGNVAAAVTNTLSGGQKGAEHHGNEVRRSAGHLCWNPAWCGLAWCDAGSASVCAAAVWECWSTFVQA